MTIIDVCLHKWRMLDDRRRKTLLGSTIILIVVIILFLVSIRLLRSSSDNNEPHSSTTTAVPPTTMPQAPSATTLPNGRKRRSLPELVASADGFALASLDSVFRLNNTSERSSGWKTPDIIMTLDKLDYTLEEMCDTMESCTGIRVNLTLKSDGASMDIDLIKDRASGTVRTDRFVIKVKVPDWPAGTHITYSCHFDQQNDPFYSTDNKHYECYKTKVYTCAISDNIDEQKFGATQATLSINELGFEIDRPLKSQSADVDDPQYTTAAHECA